MLRKLTKQQKPASMDFRSGLLEANYHLSENRSRSRYESTDWQHAETSDTENVKSGIIEILQYEGQITVVGLRNWPN
jgi:hypothetical protein